MGLVHTDIIISNTIDEAMAQDGLRAENEVRKETVRCLADSGAFMLYINEHLKNQLGLRHIRFETATLANGQEDKYEIVGPVTVRFSNRDTICRALVLPGESEVLLGAIPMEDMDVVINPKTQSLTVNPLNPYMANKSLK
jgi:clan AA aspartic protease